MSIIPIDPRQTIVHVQDDGSEIHFRYLTGEYRSKFTAVQSLVSNAAKPYIPVAKKQLKGKKKDYKSIATLAVNLAEADGIVNDEMLERQTADMIDIVVCGWKGEGFPEIKKGTKPSDYLTSVQLSEVMIIANEYMNEIMGLTVEDRKN